jgi:hypothetical protein
LIKECQSLVSLTEGEPVELGGDIEEEVVETDDGNEAENETDIQTEDDVDTGDHVETETGV